MQTLSNNLFFKIEYNHHENSINNSERVILDLTFQIRDDANRVSDELWARIREHWNEQQIVEIVYTITAYIMVSKFGDALPVELEPIFADLETQLI